MSNSVQPHRQQPTRLPCPRDSPGKNTGVGCHFLLQCKKVKSESEATQSCPSLRDPMDCSLPGYSIHEIFQPRVLEWGAITFSNNIMSESQINSYLQPLALCFWLTLQSAMGLARRRQWQPTPVLLPGKSHGWRSLVGCSPWGLEESDTTE